MSVAHRQPLRIPIRRGNLAELWTFNEVDFAQLARSMGAFGVRVEHPQEIRGALEEALASGWPAVVDVVSDIDAFAPTAYVPEQLWQH